MIFSATLQMSSRVHELVPGHFHSTVITSTGQAAARAAVLGAGSSSTARLACGAAKIETA